MISKLARAVAAVVGLLTPADGIAPAAAGTRREEIASMPESSGQGFAG